MKLSTIWRIIWPDRGPLFAIVGGIVSVISDFSQFIANIATPETLIWPVMGLAGLLAWFCFGRVTQGAALGPEGEPEEQVLRCRECDAFRVMLFAGLGAVLLLLAGQGETATERFGRQLGLIQQDVSAIREDTTALRDVSSSMELIANPRSAADYFRNAWIYNTVRRDSASAWETIQTLYQRHTPNKLDAAELYYNAGRTLLPRAQLLEQMIEIGRRKRDAAMLVIAGRNVETNEQAFGLYREALALDPDMPFAHWDVMRTQLISLRSGASPRENLVQTQSAVTGLEHFLEASARKPVASYFYIPQYQADFEVLARGQLETFRGALDNWRRIVDMQDRAPQRR